MEIERLREFVTLASQLRLSNAAQELYLSPSALSQHISALERELGCKLFTRSGGFILTEKGEAALARAQKILYEYDMMVQECTAGVSKKTMHLSIPNYHYCKQPLVETRNSFQNLHPNTEVVFSTNNCDSDNPFDVLDSGASDISMLYIVRGGGYDVGERIPQRFSYFTLQPQRCIFLSSESHPLADKEILTVDDLNGATLVDRLCPVCSVLLDGLTEALSSYGAKVRVMLLKATRSADILMNDLGTSYMVWFEMVGEEPDPLVPDLPVHRFEHELIADAFLLYRRDKLDDLQLDYLEMVESRFSGKQ